MTAPGSEIETTEDAWLGGRLRLLQPARSYRVAIDAALLAAAVPLAPGGRALELGTGVGAAALALALRAPEGAVDALELQPALAALARRNVAANGLQDRVRIVEGDVAGAAVPAGAYDEVFLNPPYLDPDANDASADPIKRTATVEGPARLQDWANAAARAARPGGGVTLIHRADRLADILAALATARIGGVIVYPLWPRPGTAARRVILRGRAGKGGRLTLAAGLVLHDAEGGYTTAAAAILAGEAGLPL